MAIDQTPPQPREAAYFFAQYPKDFALCAGLAKIVHEINPQLPLHLVCAAEPNSKAHRWNVFLDQFDSTQWIKSAMHGGLKSQFNARGLFRALTSAFPVAREAKNEMSNVEFAPNSVAFAFDAFSLNGSIFLRRVQNEPSALSVLFAEQTDDALLSDYVFGYSESFFLNLFQRWFGTALFDVFWMRTPEGERTSQREYRFRNKPSDYVFFGEHAFRRNSLRPGQAYWPYYRSELPEAGTDGAIVVFGGMYEWEALISLVPFYRRYNELLAMIRAKHPNHRLVYLAHPSLPGESEREIERLDLDGFEILRGISSEALVETDRRITTAYSIYSTAIFTTACMGLRTHFLYRLFDDDSIPEALKQRLDGRWDAPIHPEMVIRSSEKWMDGENDYDVSSSSDRVRSATVSVLRNVGVEVTKPSDFGKQLIVTAEERWLPPLAAIARIEALRNIIGIPSGYGVVAAAKRQLSRILHALERLIRNGN
jgi:hypothetical protein